MGVLPLAAALLLATFQDPPPPRNPPQDLSEGQMDARLGRAISRSLEASIVGQSRLQASPEETGDSPSSSAMKVRRGGSPGATWKS